MLFYDIALFYWQSGEIFVFSGLFDMITNDDQLAVVIGHEMSHAVLNHGVGILY